MIITKNSIRLPVFIYILIYGLFRLFCYTHIHSVIQCSRLKNSWCIGKTMFFFHFCKQIGCNFQTSRVTFIIVFVNHISSSGSGLVLFELKQQTVSLSGLYTCSPYLLYDSTMTVLINLHDSSHLTESTNRHFSCFKICKCQAEKTAVNFNIVRII